MAKKKTDATAADHAELDAVTAQLEEARAALTATDGAAAGVASINPAVVVTIVESILALIRQLRNR